MKGKEHFNQLFIFKVLQGYQSKAWKFLRPEFKITNQKVW